MCVYNIISFRFLYCFQIIQQIPLSRHNICERLLYAKYISIENIKCFRSSWKMAKNTWKVMNSSMLFAPFSQMGGGWVAKVSDKKKQISIGWNNVYFEISFWKKRIINSDEFFFVVVNFYKSFNKKIQLELTCATKHCGDNSVDFALSHDHISALQMYSTMKNVRYAIILVLLMVFYSSSSSLSPTLFPGIIHLKRRHK